MEWPEAESVLLERSVICVLNCGELLVEGETGVCISVEVCLLGGGGIGAGRVPTVAAITTALSPTPELLPLKVTHRSPLLTHLKVAIAACAS